MKSAYFHDRKIHNTNAGMEIVPKIMELFNPKSVIDIGCGIGTWGVAFKEAGITDYIGVDGDYVNPDLLLIDSSKFLSTDLTEEFCYPRKFDLAISLEVAEHLPEYCAETFVETLVNLSDIIVFSAAIKGQGGQNHLNEQFPEYWQQRFAAYNYELVYNFSQDNWNKKGVEWWYQQNMVAYRKRVGDENGIELKSYIHPELYRKKLGEIHELKKKVNSLYRGEIPLFTAFKILVKSFLNVFK